MELKEKKICVVGLGYVGLPLARLFSTKYQTVGFDMNQRRVDTLMAGHDATLEVADDLLQDAVNNCGFVCTTDLDKSVTVTSILLPCQLPSTMTTLPTSNLFGGQARLLARLSIRETLSFMNQPFTLA